MASEHFAGILEKEFNATLPHPTLSLIKALKAAHPHEQHIPILQGFGHGFDLLSYLAAIGVEHQVVRSQTHAHFQYSPRSGRVVESLLVGVLTFTYEGVGFTAYRAGWKQDREQIAFYDLVFSGTDDRVGRKLVASAFKWADELKEEMWVFEMGGWMKNNELYKAVQAASWDEIVLEETFKDNLRRDTETFFKSQDVYRSLGITWKRGLLLLGPPGNGKTESIKALLKEFSQYPALYVKSISTQMGPELGVKQVFDHARNHAPCILVLEDLDSVLTDNVRSFFLNEMDGLAKNDGILTIATTNHAERIDDAILNRPSRFDVKYNYALPNQELRQIFTTKWLKKVTTLDAGASITFETPEDVIAKKVSEQTDGWSFAFMKELFVSFLLRIAHNRALRKDETSMESLLYQQIEQLSAQIIRAKELDGSDPGSDPSMSNLRGLRALKGRAAAMAPFFEPVPFIATQF